MTELRIPGGAPPPADAKPLVVKDRVGLDVRLELQHLERNLGLGASQRAAVHRLLKSLDALLRRQVVERRRHRDKTLALYRVLARLNKAFAKTLKRQLRDAEAGRRALRGPLTPAQRRQFDLLMAERARFEREFIRSKVARDKSRPPSRRSV